MPTYEYVCASCGNAWEEIQKITEPAVEVCPSCHKATAKRQISGGTFILKGGGWYSDLYSSAKPAAATKEDSSGSGDKAESKSETKTEAKAEAKSESKTETKSETKAPATAETKKSSPPKGDGGGGGSSGSGGASKAAE